MSIYKKLFEQGKFDRCEKKCRQVLAKDAANIDARLTLVLSLLEQNRFQPALEECRKAIKTLNLDDGDKGTFCNLLADSNRNLGDHGEAIKWYSRARKLLGDRPGLLHGALLSHVSLDQFDEALQCSFDLLESSSHLPDGMTSDAVFQISQLSEEINARDLLKRFPRLMKRIPRVDYHAAMGRLFERQQDYAQALEHFETLNELRRHGTRYDLQLELDYLQNCMAAFDQQFIDEPAFEWPAASPRPVFIVGMPRSGSTLIEQMLGAHSRIEAQGETGWMVETLPPPLELYGSSAQQLRDRALDSAFCEQARNSYMEKIREVDADCVIDKTLSNIERLWLIHRAFPEALVIHARRQRAPTVWSCFKTNFTRGNHFSETLEGCAAYCDAVHALADHWRSLLAERYIEIPYEEFVDQPSRYIDEILTKLELTPEEQCYDPTRNTRVARSASMFQVMKPVYQGANKNWESYRDIIEEKYRIQLDQPDTA